MIDLNIEGFSSKYIDDLQQLISVLAPGEGVINARVIDEDEMRRLNNDYAGKDESTDVLSFSYLDSENEERITDNDSTDSGLRTPDSELGDIVISSDHIKSQANLAGTTEETEFILLLLHGILHVLGFDHATETQREEMDRLQGEFMKKLGLVYRDFGWHS